MKTRTVIVETKQTTDEWIFVYAEIQKIVATHLCLEDHNSLDFHWSNCEYDDNADEVIVSRVVKEESVR